MRGLLSECGRRFFDRRLAGSTAGNLSHRTDLGYLITATNTSLGSLQPTDFAEFRWATAAFEDGPRPSKEYPFHQLIYERRSDVQAVVHLHSPAATALSCVVEPTDHGNALPVVTPYAVLRVGRVPCVEYIRPGTQRLAERIADVCLGVNAILLQNHGAITMGGTLEEAAAVAEELESCAEIYLLTQGRARVLTPGEIAEL